MCILSQNFELTLSLYLFRPDLESDSDAEDIEHSEKLRQVKAVLEEVISSLDSAFVMILMSIFCIMNPLVLEI